MSKHRSKIRKKVQKIHDLVNFYLGQVDTEESKYYINEY